MRSALRPVLAAFFVCFGACSGTSGDDTDGDDTSSDDTSSDDTSDTSEDTGGTGSAVIGAAGGTVQGAGALSGVKVTIPANALASDTTITITARAEIVTTLGVAIGPAVDLGPSGTVFAAPVQVELPYVEAELEHTVADVFVAHVPETGDPYLEAPIYVRDGKVVIETDSFSGYGALDAAARILGAGPPPETIARAAPKRIAPHGQTVLSVQCPPTATGANWREVDPNLGSMSPMSPASPGQWEKGFGTGSGPAVTTHYMIECVDAAGTKLDTRTVEVTVEDVTVGVPGAVQVDELAAYNIPGAVIYNYAVEGDGAEVELGYQGSSSESILTLPVGAVLRFGPNSDERAVLQVTNTAGDRTDQAAQTRDLAQIATFDIAIDESTATLFHVTVSATNTNTCSLDPDYGSIPSPFEKSEFDFYGDPATTYTLTCADDAGDVTATATPGEHSAATVEAAAGGMGSAGWFVTGATSCAIGGQSDLPPAGKAFLSAGTQTLVCTGADGNTTSTPIEVH